MSNTYRGYGLTPDGTATPISDPGAYQRGEVVDMAADSQMLWGKPASDYFLAEDAENLGGIKMELLWENASPTSAFAGQFVRCDLAQYKKISILWGWATDSTTTFVTDAYIGKTITVDKTLSSGYGIMQIQRQTVSVDTSGITFSIAQFWNGSTRTDDNAYCIPLLIYGIKEANV